MNLASRGLQLVSLAILAFQIYIPWSVDHYVTQDGPSHVYTAFVTGDLLLHRHTSPYHAVYRVQKTALPNWTSTALMALFVMAAGPDHAEAFITTVCLLAGYFSFAYGVRSLTAGSAAMLLLGNWLAQTWFVWGGFYNFSLGMALLPLGVGYYIRHEQQFTRRHAAVLSAGLVALFFTHLIPALLAALAIAIICLCSRRGWQSLAVLAAAFTPLVLLVLVYARSFSGSPVYQPDLWETLKDFPQKVFIFAAGWKAEQLLIWPAMLLVILAALALMRRSEWRSARGGVGLTAIACFVLYAVLPDAGLGGSVIKMRFALGVFVFGGMLVCSVDRLRWFQFAIGLYVAVVLMVQLGVMAGQAKQTSAAVAEYLSVMNLLPAGARFVRIEYPSPTARHRFATDRLSFDPLHHVESLAAVRKHAVSLSDYQAATGTFSAAFKPAVAEAQRYSLWGLEAPDANTWASLDWLRGNLPVPIEYAVVVGDEEQPEMVQRAQRVNPESQQTFVRLYRLSPISP